MGTHDLRIRLAQVAQREGRGRQAAALYAQVVFGNPYLVEAWWGLSETIRDPQHALYCVKQVLALAPYHLAARERLKALSLEVMTDSMKSGVDLSSDAFRDLVARLDKPIFN